MKVLHKFQIEVYDIAQSEELDRLGIPNSEESADVMIVDLYLDLADVETFRKTYMTDKIEIECVNIQTKSGESYILLITEEEFIEKYENYFGVLEIR